MKDLHHSLTRLARRLRSFEENFAAAAAWQELTPLLQLRVAQLLAKQR